MGDEIIDDGDLIFNYDGVTSSGEAADESGQLILESVSLTVERDNDPKHGISNKEPQAMSYGNKTYTLSFEGHVNEAIADVVVAMYLDDQTPRDADLRSEGAMEATIGKIDWNSVEKSGSDDGDVTLSVDADCRNVDLNTGV